MTTLSNLIYANNNTINSYKTTNNLYRSTLSGNIKYITSFITSLSGNLYLNCLTQTNASNIYQPISLMPKHLTVTNAGYHLLKCDAAITYMTISNMNIFLTIGNARIPNN